MKSVKMAAAMVSCMLLFTGCVMAPNATGLSEEDIRFIQLDEVKEGQEIAIIDTTLGTIQMVLYPEEAPKTVAYFKKLVNEGFYNNQKLFIESTNKTVVTGTADDAAGKGVINTEDGKAIECEVTPNLWHFSGAVSVVGYQESKLSQKMLSDSRFFIIGDVDATTDMVNQMEEYSYPEKVIKAYKEHGGLPQYTGAYTVFGQVISGMDIVDKITALAVDENKNPTDDSRIVKITLSTYHAADTGSSGDASSEGDTAESGVA